MLVLNLAGSPSKLKPGSHMWKARRDERRRQIIPDHSRLMAVLISKET